MPRNVICLQGDCREETRTATPYDITPGMIVELVSGGEVIPQTVDGGQVLPIFVREQHENQGADPDDDISAGDECTIIFPGLGVKINAYTTATLTEGDPLTPDGSGGVRLADSGDYVIGYAAADSDLSGTNGRVELYVAPLGVSA